MTIRPLSIRGKLIGWAAATFFLTLIFVAVNLVMSDQSPLRSTARQNVQAVLFVLGMSTLITPVVAWKLQPSPSGPFSQLLAFAKRVSASGGQVGGEAEVALLAGEINVLRGRIQERENELGQYRSHVDEMTVRIRELTRTADDALAASRAKSDFLANLSHELRTPLKAILGYTDLLRRRADAEDKRARDEFVQAIHLGGQHLLGLINDILDLSKIEAGRLEVQLDSESPHQIIAEVISVLRVRAHEKGLNLDYHWIGPIPATIATDSARLRQLLFNIVGNAIKFTESGSVLLTAELLSDDDPPELRIDVIDSGIGIADDKVEQLFEPFSQADTSRRFGGTGLGLSISRRIARALGGDVSVSSEPGLGSIFTITIATGSLDNVALLSTPPVADIISGCTPEASEKLPSLPQAKVLLVEDGDTNRRLINLMLGRYGITVTEACNGQIGVNLASQRDYDVILMDMQMPVKDGYTATGELRAKGLRTPIIALTAHAMKDDEQLCRNAGCTDYLTKPIDEERLIRKLAEYLGTVATQTPAKTRRGALRSALPADFQEIIEEFVNQLGERLTAMHDDLDHARWPELKQAAHWLRGTGGTAGFNEFTHPATRLERAAGESDEITATQLLDELDSMFAAIDTSLPAVTV